MVAVNIPFNYKPRDYQLPLLREMDNGCKRAVVIWHRRSGKDKTCLNYTIKRMFERVGIYHYYMPTLSMARKVLWDGVDKDGMRFLDHFPKEIIADINQQEMKIRLKNGSLFQIIGTDRLEVVGTNPVGCVFGEFSLQNPKGWDYARPILAENGGWAIFNYTPRGKNHGWDLWKMAQGNSDWFSQILNVDDTGAITKEAIEDERKAGMPEDLIQQEFYCSFDLGISGSYYSQLLHNLRLAGQIGNVPFDISSLVYIAFDVGFDATCLWFFQLVGQEVHLIDYYENTGQPISHYVNILQSRHTEQKYNYGTMFMPHDSNQREMQTGLTLSAAVKNYGYKVHVIEREMNVDVGINRTMNMFPRLWIDEKNCERGIVVLENYRREYDEMRKCYNQTPLHDWASHGSDALRILSAGIARHTITSSGASKQDISRWQRKYRVAV